MSRALSDLLGAKEPSFTHSLRRLETDSGHPNIDVNLVSDIASRSRSKLKELGLDPNDTTGPELYQALQSLTSKHDEFLTNMLGVGNTADLSSLLKAVVDKVKSMSTPKECWVLKHSAAKRLLKATPPKKLMKFMGYRSIDSLLKRESVEKIYTGIQLLESSNWRNKFIASYKKLNPSDFETRKLKVEFLDDQQWNDIAEDYEYDSHQNIVVLKELGAAIVLPLPLPQTKGLVITIMPMLLSTINEIQLYSSFFKLQQVKPDFSNILVSSLTNKELGSFKLADQKLSWRVIHKHYGTKTKTILPDLFDPYIQAEDLAWQKAESLLYKIEPALKFWEDMDWVAGYYDGKPVPLGLADNAISYLNDLDYGQQSVEHFRVSLGDELYKRYIGQKTIEDQIIKQLETESKTSNPLVADLRSLF